jgi:hypothetical protein
MHPSCRFSCLALTSQCLKRDKVTLSSSYIVEGRASYYRQPVETFDDFAGAAEVLLIDSSPSLIPSMQPPTLFAAKMRYLIYLRCSKL